MNDIMHKEYLTHNCQVHTTEVFSSSLIYQYAIFNIQYSIFFDVGN
jgi:hypothetical protein